MKTQSLSLFIVLIERRALQRTAALTALVLAIAAGWSNGAHAEKLSKDMRATLDAQFTPRDRHVRELHGVRQVQAIVVTDGVDPSMADLRADILRRGGSIHAAFPSLHALTVQVKASQVRILARRDDVVSVSPNRTTLRSASTLESVSGALAGNVRTNSTKTGYSGLDGTGIGIAVLDSGVMKAHVAFLDGAGSVRVKRNVTMLNTSLAAWTTGVDNSASLMPGSAALASYESAIANDNNLTQDGFGHGTHVASVAAGRARAFSSGTPDTTGIAPNANIYDIKVLNDQGVGTVSDALEGIQWAIYHSKELNIRVLNLSLASSSTESWQTDPLCVAVRSAAAMGITVVVSAGNYGQSSSGQTAYGTIGAPGNDPSVITVGAVNFKNTTSRGDDVVANFSSRGPTRSAFVDAGGVRRVDNLIKPDLVAPGNKIMGAAATRASSGSLTWD